MHDQKYIVFNLGNDRYAFSIDHVERIMTEVPVTKIPRVPKLVLGVFELRGATIPVIDLRERFCMSQNSTDGTFVIIEGQFGRVAVRVDQVEGITTATPDMIDELPPTLSVADDPVYFQIIKSASGLVVMLSPDALVPHSLHRKFAKMEEKTA